MGGSARLFGCGGCDIISPTRTSVRGLYPRFGAGHRKITRRDRWRFLALSTLDIRQHDSAMLPFVQASCGWKPLYEAALLETDTTKLPQRIAAARNAILDRIEESLRNSLPAEHRVMNDALRKLRRLAEVATARTVA